MKLSKIWDDIAERRSWGDPANRDTDLYLAFIIGSAIVFTGAAVGGVFDKKTHTPPQIERSSKPSNETIPAYRSLSRE